MNRISEEKRSQIIALLVTHSQQETAKIAGVGLSTVGRINKELRTDESNPLAAYTPRQLMQELRRRGYTGPLQYVQKIDIDKI